MRNHVRQVGAIVRAVIEWLVLFAVVFHIAQYCYALQEQLWMPEFSRQALAPTLILLMVILAHRALDRWTGWEASSDLSTTQPVFVGTITWAMTFAVPVTLLSAARIAPMQTLLQAWEFSTVAASLLAVIALAAAEELVYRQFLLGRMLRFGISPWIAVLIQALIFHRLHGPEARTSADTMQWYLLAGVTLGTIYFASRSMLMCTAAHALANVAMAQASPSHAWLTSGAVEVFERPWRPLAMAALLVLNLTFWLYWAWRRRRPHKAGAAEAGHLQHRL